MFVALNEYGKLLSHFRKRAGLSRDDVAIWMGQSSRTIERWERSETSPDAGQLAALAELYGCKVGHLFGEESLPPDEPIVPRVAFCLLQHPAAAVSPSLAKDAKEAAAKLNSRYKRDLLGIK